MRKIYALMLAAILICSCTMITFAEGATYPTAGDWYQACNKNLPDYVCGVWSTDGSSYNLTIGIQNNEAGEAGKQELLELVEDDSTVSFAYQVYSRNYLYQIFQELHEYFQKDMGLITLGLSDMDNQVHMRILEEKKSDPNAQNLISEITQKYGDAIGIEYIDRSHIPTLEEEETEPVQPTQPTEPNPPTGEAQTATLILWPTLAAKIALIIAIVSVVVFKRKMFLL